MDVRWLQDFLTVAEAGNFRQAANACHSSQPAFSRRIQSLESWLGVELIDRSRYPTALTPAGERFKVHAAELVRRIVDTRADLQGEPTSDDEQITFALLGMTVAGHGVAWLPECTAEAAVLAGSIRAIGDDHWSLPMTV